MSQRKPVDDIERSVKALESKSLHIHGLRFPNYRSFRLDTKLPFDFPITVLLGRNGTNKSSILHALYGSTQGNSVRDFWFETDLDAIVSERNGCKQSVVHKYKNDKGEIVECIKVRAPRAGDSDYWEPAKHTRVYGFSDSGSRISPVKLDVTHLDFRGELTAFDKYFYFPDPKHLEERERDAIKRGRTLRGVYRKQDYLRRRSKSLKKKISDNGIELSSDELKLIKYILERDYISGKMLKHSLFHGHEGWTILFKTGQAGSYSDAFAGSGESAATLLVHNILEAPAKSLVLLDEPETSLHPRAQQRLLEFIAHQAVRKSLQIVMATHSSYLAKSLPQRAIRVLVREGDDSVTVRTDLSANEALHEIGSLPPGKTILVEDERAKDIVVQTLELASIHILREFKVVIREGGTSRIYRDIQSYANSEKSDIFIIFDGDHRPQTPIPSDEDLSQSKNRLGDLLKQLTCGKNESGPDLAWVDKEEMMRYIRFFRKFVYFLPGQSPEELVWEESAVEEILLTYNKDLQEEVRCEPDPKKRIYLLAQEIPGFKTDTVFSNLLAKMLNSQSQEQIELLEIVGKIRSIAS